MTDYDAVHIRQLIDDAIAARQLVTADMLTEALAAVKRDAASETELRRTNAVVQIEQAARQALETRLSQLESDVQAIDNKMGQVLENIGALKASQDDHFDDVKALRNEVHALATATDTLLDLSRERQATTNRLADIQDKHSQLLNHLTDEGGERAEELVRLESSMTSLQAATVANQTKLERIAVRIDQVDDVLTGLDLFVTMVTSKRAQSIILGGAALLISAAFDVDVVAIVQTVLGITGGA